MQASKIRLEMGETTGTSSSEENPEPSNLFSTNSQDSSTLTMPQKCCQASQGRYKPDLLKKEEIKVIRFDLRESGLRD